MSTRLSVREWLILAWGALFGGTFVCMVLPDPLVAIAMGAPPGLIVAIMACFMLRIAEQQGFGMPVAIQFKTILLAMIPAFALLAVYWYQQMGPKAIPVILSILMLLTIVLTTGKAPDSDSQISDG